jgi:hypothetical protein
MKFSEDDLRAAAKAGFIPGNDVERLVAFLAKCQPDAVLAPARLVFDMPHVLWYAGALIVIGAMGIFSTVAFSQMGGRALTICAIFYAVVFILVGHDLLTRKHLKTLGGLLITVAVSMAPLAVFGVQESLGWWGKFGPPGEVRDFYFWIKGSWVFMEIAAILAGILALRFYRFPFITSVIAVALWFLSMDLTPWVFGVSEFDFETRRQVSVWFGLGILAVAWIVDYRGRAGDFAFWLHLFGLMAFWGGITCKESASELATALYCLLNVTLLLVAVVTMRRAYAVFGALGITSYLGHLASVVFKDSLFFPFALSLIGCAVIALGLLYYREQQRIADWLAAHLPEPALRLNRRYAP